MQTNPTKNPYGQILESTTVVGGSQAINLILGVIRTKILAVLLGPAGIGLMGLYTAVTSTVSAITGMGIESSGVRQIAAAAGTGDASRIAHTIAALRRSALGLGFIGMLMTIIFREQLSRLTFGTAENSWSIALLSVTILFTAVSGGQIALIQGTRRIPDLAMLSVLGSFLGTAVSIPIIFLLGNDGIVPFLITLSLMGIFCSWWYARKIPIVSIAFRWLDTLREIKGLLSFGLVFMSSGLMLTAAMYFVRILLVRQVGMDGVGLYQASTTLSSIYIGIVLRSMGMDFYPRLTAVEADNNACNQMVNQQTEVGLLIAVPGILLTLTFTPLVIQVLYSASFIPAYEVLRWQILGVFLRVTSWPLSYVLLAKGKKLLYFCTELTANSLHVLLVWISVGYFGLPGAGMAFFVLYVFYTILLLVIVNRITQFRWTPSILRIMALACLSIAATFLLPHFVSQISSLVAGALLILISTAYSLRALYQLAGPTWIAASCRKLKARLGD